MFTQPYQTEQLIVKSKYDINPLDSVASVDNSSGNTNSEYADHVVEFKPTETTEDTKPNTTTTKKEEV